VGGKGGQQMLTIARTLMGDAELILRDEPSEGLVSVVLKELVRLIRDVRKDMTAL